MSCLTDFEFYMNIINTSYMPISDRGQNKTGCRFFVICVFVSHWNIIIETCPYHRGMNDRISWCTCSGWIWTTMVHKVPSRRFKPVLVTRSIARLVFCCNVLSNDLCSYRSMGNRQAYEPWRQMYLLWAMGQNWSGSSTVSKYSELMWYDLK